VRENAQAIPFRIAIFILACIPVSAGAAGVVFGAGFPGFDAGSASADLDSHFRFLSGVFLAVGIGFWTCALNRGNAAARFNLLVVLVFAGGVARLISLLHFGAPSAGHMAGLAMELIVVPLLALWQHQRGCLRRPAARAGL